MRKSVQHFLIFISEIVNVLFITFTFSVCWFRYYTYSMSVPWIIPCGIFLIFYISLIRLYEGFRLDRYHGKNLVLSQFLASFIPHLLYYFLYLVINFEFLNIFPLIITSIVNYVFILFWVYFVQKKYNKNYHPKHGLIIYSKSKGLMNRLTNDYIKRDFYTIEKMSISVFNRQSVNPLIGIDVVFLYGIPEKSSIHILQYCISNNITVYTIPTINDMVMLSGSEANLVHLPLLKINRYQPSNIYLFVKRAVDIIFSLLGIIILSPFMIITAFLVKLDGGPALYKQTRLTKNEKEFEILKFRSMRVDAEKDGVARLSTGDKDDRITKVGKIIRKIRFDELPQLFNILKGDMTIVGPRPERPEIADQYYEFLPEFRLRLQAKAGLTGYAQVYGQYNTEPEDKLLFDLMYISHPSLWNDLKIMFATIKVLFIKDSTEGIAEGQTTAGDAGKINKLEATNFIKDISKGEECGRG